MIGAPQPGLARAFRRTALPLAAYYAVTLALPLANGAASGGAFVRHAGVVLVVPPLLVAFAYAAHRAARWSVAQGTRKESRSSRLRSNVTV
jgi:hypothetical protein